MNNEPNKEITKLLLELFNQKNYAELIGKSLNLQSQYPKSIFLLNIQGAAYNFLNDLDNATICFKKIIKIDPNFADAYYNLGIIYKKLNKIELSILNYEICLKIKKDKYEAYNNLGNIYKDKNNVSEAVKKYLQCLEINSKYLIALQNFGVCLQNFRFSKKTQIVDKNIIYLLKSDKILRPVDIMNCLIHYLYLDPQFSQTIKNYKKIKNVSIENFIDNILNFKILILLLKITPITDIKIERFLKYLRKEILLNINTIENKQKVCQLMNAIAEQCFINEYLYEVSTKEKSIIKNIEKNLLDNLKKNTLNKNFLEISCLGAYKSLNNYSWSKQIDDLEEIKDLVRQQITEPNIEKFLKEKLLSNKIKDKISLKVKNQYETNPYPRWTKIALNRNPDKITSFVKNRNLDVEDKEIKKWKAIDVLVAGCGTGQHAITTATKYQNSFITAIDLSSNSLCYAKRKADELNINNIEFKQMDILDLKNTKKKFDLIESVGVIHHMNNPYEGWKILSDILNLGGLMMIGVYSNLARLHIKKIRAKITDNQFEINNESIKKFREKIISSQDKDCKIIQNSPDFYSISSIKDLLFHVQEYRFNLNEIEDYLNKLGLKFCGFENKEVLRLFKEKFKNESDLYNLKLWEKFEIKNPRVFASMYQFWCQKN